LQKKEVFAALAMAVTNRANEDDSSHRAPAITSAHLMASSVDTIADQENIPIIPSQWDSTRERNDSSISTASEDNQSKASRTQDAISIFQQPSFSSEKSWDTCQFSTDAHLVGTTNDHPTPSHTSFSAATFNSDFSQSTAFYQVQGIRPEPDKEPPQPILLPPVDSELDPDVPTIISQDPKLIESWRLLFAKASRPPTNLAEAENQGPKYRQEYLDLIERTPNIPSGNSMAQRMEALCRLYFVNINVISAAEEFLAFQDTLESLLASGMDIFGLSETNLDWRRHLVRDTCGKICSDFYVSSLVATSTSPRRSNSTYTPGGTCTGLTQKYCGRYQNSGSDPHGLGRWSFI
jgi:hypothetical protein